LKLAHDLKSPSQPQREGLLLYTYEFVEIKNIENGFRAAAIVVMNV
jgi:hypothetical protein